jgi:hypothetical protein
LDSISLSFLTRVRLTWRCIADSILPTSKEGLRFCTFAYSETQRISIRGTLNVLKREIRIKIAKTASYSRAAMRTRPTGTIIRIVQILDSGPTNTLQLTIGDYAPHDCREIIKSFKYKQESLPGTSHTGSSYGNALICKCNIEGYHPRC